MELTQLVLLAPLFKSNLRVSPPCEVQLVDASPWATAVVSSPVPAHLGRELCRHTLTRGRWTHLLPGRKALLYKRGQLPEDEVTGEPYVTQPWVLDVCRSLPYRTKFKGRTVGSEHINLGEIRAHLMAERLASIATPCSDILVGADSQVQLGSSVRGRGGGRSMNRYYRKGLGYALGGGGLLS